MIFNVLILGSGAAMPTSTRHCSGQLVSMGGKRMLIDCGEGSQDRLRKYHQRFQSISYIFISHLHGDHFFGLPGLLSTMHLCGRTEPVTVFAPKGAKEAIELLFKVSGTELRYALTIEELDFEDVRVVCDDTRFVVKAFPLRHSVPTYGFIFEEKELLLNLRKDAIEKYGLTPEECVKIKHGEDLVRDDGLHVSYKELTMSRRLPRRYAYCCDTASFDELVSIVKGSDLLCLESTFDDSFEPMASEKLHCTASQAATVAMKAGVQRLMLTHFSARFKEIDCLMEEARAVFPDTFPATDGEVYEIPYRYEK